MNTQIGLILGCGLIISIPVVLRAYLTGRLVGRMQRLVVEIAKQINSRKLQDPGGEKFHALEFMDMTIWLAGVLPLIATGRLRPLKLSQARTEQAMRKEYDASIDRFFNDNGWALGYAASIAAIIQVAEYLACPWNPLRFLKAALAGLFLRFFVNESGQLQKISVDQTSDDLARVEVRRKIDGGLGFGNGTVVC